jgi:hypothetical protein
MRFVWVPRILAALGLFALAGCHFFHRHSLSNNSCNEVQPYAAAHSIPPLKIPVGLAAPDTHAALRIPDLNQPAPPPRPLTDPCLDSPPKFVVPKVIKPPQA